MDTAVSEVQLSELNFGIFTLEDEQRTALKNFFCEQDVHITSLPNGFDKRLVKRCGATQGGDSLGPTDSLRLYLSGTNHKNLIRPL